VRWLPHARPGDGQDTAVLVGADDTARARRIGELLQLLGARAASRRSHGPSGGAGLDGPAIIVIIDGARAVRSLPGVISILRDGPALGVYSICLDRETRLLPSECQAVVEQTPTGLRVGRTRSEVVDDVRPDLVGTRAALDPYGDSLDEEIIADGAAAWCERLARALAPIRDSGDDSEATIPAEARLLDVLGLEPPSAAAIAARWTISPGATAFPIGLAMDGPFDLDLRRDGPHGLIAGTTGAGKSELLQSIVASLAVVNRPDAMTFVLVDYKGGSAFADCVDLPHCVGMVTDLDNHLVARALTSLNAELRRREHILAGVGAKDIEDYGLLVDRARSASSRQAVAPVRRPTSRSASASASGQTPAPTPSTLAALPRLLIVIDEFASLARELPDFVTGLVNIAQRGRSLGIHLLLATQRPSGVVSPEIRANTNLRIALRVTDTGESTDVIDSPDAARIGKSTPGRAFVRLGHASLVPFQAGRVGGRRPAATVPTTAGVPAPWVARLPWSALGGPAPEPPRTGAPDGEITDLRVLVSEIRQAARSLDVPIQPSPWLPPLPDVVTVDELGLALPPRPADRAGRSPRRLPPVPVGLSDFCAEQAQRAYAIDLEAGGHLMIVGSARSGRSTVLRTFAGALAATIPSSDVHLYGLDCGNNALTPLAGLPHTGAVVSRDSPERVGRLFTRLQAEVAARQEAFAARGYADLGEQRDAEPTEALPYLVLVLDRFEGFLTAFENIDGGLLVDVLLRLLREGPSVGLRVLLTTDRRGLTGRVASAIEDRLVLRLADRGDYPMVGLAPAAVPEGMAAGRGFRIGAGGDAAGGGAGAGGGGARMGVVETQLALLGRDPAGRAQVAALNRLGAWAAERDGVPAGPATGPRTDPRRPFRIDPLPALISGPEVLALGAPAGAGSRALVALVGAGGDELAPVHADLGLHGPGFTIAGPPRSGRSSTLVTMAASLLAGGARVILVAPRPSPLRDLAGAQGVLGLLGGTARSDEVNDLVDTGRDAAAGVVVVLDDAELVQDAPIAAVLTDFLRSARDAGGALVAAGTTEDLTGQFRGFMVDARRSRCGVILSPAGPADGELFGVRLSRAVGGTLPPGRGLFFQRGATMPIQVARPASDS
jgi:S-DNA-T family DNA segregation ATPase FtsK/SpoIIIE